MTRLVTLLLCASALAGCGLHDPDLKRPVTVNRAAGTPPARAPALDPALATPTAAVAVLRAFADTYASSSRTDATRQQRTLGELATPALASALHRSARQAALEAQRALPTGAQLTGHVLSLQLAPASARTRRGVVVIEQALTRHGQPLENPFTTVFIATLTRAGRRWEVAKFTPQP